MFSKCLVLSLAAVLVSCNSSGPQVSSDQKKKEEEKKKGGGPGGDDDYPLTMVGGSLDFAWDDAGGLSEVDDNTRLYAFSASLVTRVNEVRYRLKNDSGPLGQVVFRRKTGQGLAITINYGPMAASEVQISSTSEEDANGTRVSAPNLTIVSLGGATAMMKDYEKIGRFFIKHPQKGHKVRTIKLAGVVLDSQSGNHGCDVSASPIVCTVNTPSTDIDSRLRISVCRPINGSCPQAAP